MLRLISLAALTALAACSATPDRFAVPAAPVEARSERISYRSVEVRQVSLPTYAASEEIYVRSPEGALASSGLLWADEPTRAVTQELARYLTQLTGAQVAAEPWPFYEPAQARVEVRVEEMLAEGDQVFVMSGQYFVAPESSGRRDRSGLFRLSAPIGADGGALAIAAARGEVVRDLARTIAREALR